MTRCAPTHLGDDALQLVVESLAVDEARLDWPPWRRRALGEGLLELVLADLSSAADVGRRRRRCTRAACRGGRPSRDVGGAVARERFGRRLVRADADELRADADLVEQRRRSTVLRLQAREADHAGGIDDDSVRPASTRRASGPARPRGRRPLSCRWRGACGSRRRTPRRGRASRPARP